MPVVLLYLAFQKQLVGGLTTGIGEVTAAPTRQQPWLSPAAPRRVGALRLQPVRPRLGDRVDVLVRVPLEADGRRRSTCAPRPTARRRSRVARRCADAPTPTTWWRATLTATTPSRATASCSTGGPTKYAWLNGTGVHLRDVPDASDFRLVAHARRRRRGRWDAVVYQIFPDRFARSAGPTSTRRPTGRSPRRGPTRSTSAPRAVAHQLYGGDLDGITEHLDHLESLGVDVVYLTPFFPARSNHRYDASSLRADRPAARRRRRAAPADEGRARARHEGDGRLHDEPHGQRPRVVPQGGRPGRQEQRRSATTTSGRTATTSPGSASRPCPSSTTSTRRCAAASSRTRGVSCASGWAAPAGSTAGGSTSPT